MKDYRNLTNKEAWEEFNKLTPDEIIRECEIWQIPPREGKGWRTTDNTTYFTEDCRGFFLSKENTNGKDIYWLIYMGNKVRVYWDIMISYIIDAKGRNKRYLVAGPLTGRPHPPSETPPDNGMVWHNWERDLEVSGEVEFRKGNMHDITHLLFPSISSFINWSNENPLEAKE